MKTFTEFAHEKMLDLFNNHSQEVGSVLKQKDPVKYKDYKSTDCITYVLNVMSYAFEQSGQKEMAKKVWSLGQRGTELARFLVNSHSWKGVYINPDSKHPTDANEEHSFSSHLASKTCKYYQIPLEYKVHNYATTPKNHEAFQVISKNSPVTKLNEIDYNSLALVKFGFGVSKGGRHTWLFSEGHVYEVHWDKIGVDLYEKTSLREFPWLSGAIVVPSDQAAKIATSAKLKCGLN